MWRRKPGTFGLGVSQDSPATNPLETAKGFLTLILFFHCLSLVLHSQTHKYLNCGFVTINNSTTCDCVIFHNLSVREVSLLNLQQQNWNTASCACHLPCLGTTSLFPGLSQPRERAWKALRGQQESYKPSVVLNPSGRRQTLGTVQLFPWHCRHTQYTEAVPCLLPMQGTGHLVLRDKRAAPKSPQQ